MSKSGPAAVLCVDVGSTFIKAVLVDVESGAVLATASRPTITADMPDVLAGIGAVLAETESAANRRADDVLACSSAGGGLRLAVVGYERLVTAEAGRRVALSAGGRVVWVSSGPLDAAGLQAIRDARPDLIVLTGGTDGGNADVVLHNARRLGIVRLPIPVVLAGNAEAAQAAADELRSRGRTVIVTANLLPQIGRLDPEPARKAIREAFLAHVIGGKGLSRRSSTLAGRTFAELVRASTPDAVLTGVGLLAPLDDVLLVDVGGATTDVYSILAPSRDGSPRRPGPFRQVVEPLWHARTVEGDLGVRAGARGVVEAAISEGLLDDGEAVRLGEYADQVAAAGTDPAYLPQHPENDQRLAALAGLIAVRRHGRAGSAGAAPRPLREVSWLIGSGGVLRAASPAGRAAILRPMLADHGGGWAVPDRAGLAVDLKYTLFAAGLLARIAPEAATRLARAGLVALP